MSSPCIHCAAVGGSCCTNRQIGITGGDLKRIRRYLHHDNFYQWEQADPAYLDPGDDPEWLSLTITNSGMRQVLHRKANGDCSMLAEQGCLLPLLIRPLVCRLYPLSFRRNSVQSLDSECCLSRDANSHQGLERMGMPVELVTLWHRQLYRELDVDLLLRQSSDSTPSEPCVTQPCLGSEIVVSQIQADNPGPFECIEKTRGIKSGLR